MRFPIQEKIVVLLLYFSSVQNSRKLIPPFHKYLLVLGVGIVGVCPREGVESVVGEGHSGFGEYALTEVDTVREILESRKDKLCRSDVTGVDIDRAVAVGA